MNDYIILGMYGSFGEGPKPLKAGTPEEIEKDNSPSPEELEDIVYSLGPQMRSLPFTTAYSLPVMITFSLGRDEEKNAVVRELFIQPSPGDHFVGLERQVHGLTRPHEIFGLPAPRHGYPGINEDDITDYSAVFSMSGTRHIISAFPFNYILLEEDAIDREMLFRHLTWLSVCTDNGRPLSAQWGEDGVIQVYPDYSRVVKVGLQGCSPQAINGPQVEVDLLGSRCIVDIETPDDHYAEYRIRKGFGFGAAGTPETDKDMMNLIINALYDLPFAILEDDDNCWSIEYRIKKDADGEHLSHIMAEPSSYVEVEGLAGAQGIEIQRDIERMHELPGNLTFRYDGTLYVLKKVKLI